MNAEDRSVVGFTMLAHAMFHVYELAIPVFVTVWLDVFTASEAVLGVVVSVGYALIGVGALPSGILADTYGSKNLVLASMAGMGGGFVLVSVAPNVVVLALALVVWGAGASLYHPAGLSLLSRSTEHRGTALAYHGVAGNVGTVLGPLTAALLLTFLDWRVVAILFVTPAVVGTFVAFGLDIEEATDDATTRSTKADGGVRSFGELVTDSRTLFTGGFVVVFAIVMLYGLYYRGVLTFLPEILGDLAVFEPVTLLGRTVTPSRYVYSGLLLVGVLGQYTGGKVSDHVGTERALVVTFVALLVAAGLFVPASEAGVLPLLIVCALLGFFVYVAAPVYQAKIAETVASDTHGLSYGFTYLGMFGIGAIGAAAAGTVLTYASTTILFVGLGTLAAVAALLSAFLAVRAFVS